MGSNPASRANRLLRPVAIPIQIVGAGIAGLACAIACRQLGLPVGISERADGPRPEGAGIQLSPNAVRALHTLGLTPALRLHATEPTAIRLRSLASGASIACLAAGAYFEKKYGQPTLTIHRAALQAALLARAQALGISVRWGEGWSVDGLEGHAPGSAIIGADGLWSAVRPLVPEAQVPRPTGQAAIRGLLHICPNPRSEMGKEITVWCGHGAHLVGYPLNRQESYGFVLIHPQLPTMESGWSSPVSRACLGPVLADCYPMMRDFLGSVDDWRGWPLYAADPLKGPAALCAGRVALIGDAGHAMRPHLAQGAAMGLEDALTIARCLADGDPGRPEAALSRYAALRWQRIRRVQQRAERNGRIFQLRGAMGHARNAVLRLLGPSLMDQPWLWGEGQEEPAFKAT